MISDKVDFKSKEFISLCKSHKVKELYAFGSVVNGNFTEKSDIDLLVEIDEQDPLSKGQLLLSLWNNFERYFNRRIDILTPNSLRNPYLRDSVTSTKRLIYDGPKEEVL
jgi:predicted nucleotidyltransferase